MASANTRYVIFPRLLNLDKLNIKYQDALVYCAIRSFRNSKTGKCYPSYESIGKTAGVSKKLLTASIIRLSTAGLIIIKKTGKYRINHQYEFKKVEGFERVTYELFDANELTYSEKALMICLRQFFNHGQLKSMETVAEMSRHLGVTYNTVKKQFSSLISKGYITEHCVAIGAKSSNSYRFTNKINWIFDYGSGSVQTSNTKILLKVG